MQLNKCDVEYDSVLYRGHSGDGRLSASIMFRYECRMRLLFVSN